MELRTYWNIIRRRWLLLVIPAAIVLAIGLLTYQRPAQAYNVGARFIVGQAPGPESESADEQRYWAWVTSEYIVDGVVNWVRSRAFAELVSTRLIAEGHDIPAGAIQIIESAFADND